MPAQPSNAFSPRPRVHLTLLLFLLAPTAAYANAGTPLMWAGMIHLVVGNALIGLGEGLLLAWWFKTSPGKSVLFLIGANYVSAWLGSLLLIGHLATWVDPTIETVHVWFWIFVAAAFLFTLLLELPFFWLALRRAPNALKRSAKAALLINSLSYVLLFGWYWGASGTSMMTDLKVVPASELALPAEHELYYISASGTEVMRANLNGHRAKKIRAVGASHSNDRLFTQASRSRAGFDLFIRLHGQEHDQDRSELILENFSPHAPIDARSVNAPDKPVEGTWFNFGDVPRLMAEGDWTYWTGFWPVEGIQGENKIQQSRFRFSMETPFAAWSVRNATHLTGDVVVFQLGKDQICALHPQTKRIALLVRGKGPIVVRSATTLPQK